MTDRIRWATNSTHDQRGKKPINQHATNSKNPTQRDTPNNAGVPITGIPNRKKGHSTTRVEYRTNTTSAVQGDDRLAATRKTAMPTMTDFKENTMGVAIHVTQTGLMPAARRHRTPPSRDQPCLVSTPTGQIKYPDQWLTFNIVYHIRHSVPFRTALHLTRGNAIPSYTDLPLLGAYPCGIASPSLPLNGHSTIHTHHPKYTKTNITAEFS
jgi:hypothetical protein